MQADSGDIGNASLFGIALKSFVAAAPITREVGPTVRCLEHEIMVNARVVFECQVFL
ncbi:hypothetical protein D3C76_1798470 [compost metagenome]